MIDMEIFRSLVWGGPLSQPAFSGSRLSVKNSFVRAHLVAKDSPGIYAGRGLKQRRGHAQTAYLEFARHLCRAWIETIRNLS